MEIENLLNPEKIQKDTLKFFDICNGCRRCFNLCPSFDYLFKRLDVHDGEADLLQPKEIDRTVDLCYYCKLCYNHCPYTPPHRFQLDFPLLMVRSKATPSKKESFSFRDRLLANTDFIGKWGSFFAPLINWANKQRVLRFLLHHTLGIHKNRILPSFSKRTFTQWFKNDHTTSPTSSADSGKKKVALFSTCFINHNKTDIGQASVEVLEKNGIAVFHPPQNCCGMPYFDTGEWDKIKEKAHSNIASLKKMAEAGYDIVVPVPTCSLMIKKEYPSLFPGEDAQLVASATYDICEYLMKLHKAGELNTDFKNNPGKIFLHYSFLLQRLRKR